MKLLNTCMKQAIAMTALFLMTATIALADSPVLVL